MQKTEARDVGASPVVIPVAGGKGGVGKSLITANLGLALAAQGHDTLVVDLDFGGSNLHTFLGLPNDYPGIGEFLNRRVKSLESMAVQAGHPRLRFIPGDGRTPFTANMTYGHKTLLFRELGKLEADFVLLDLGAGTSYNILDCFGLSNQGLVVTSPELPAVMNLMVFLRQFVLRQVVREASQISKLKEMVEGEMRRSMTENAVSIESLLQSMAEVSPETVARIRQRHETLRPRLILNQVDHPDELGLLAHVEKNLQKRLSLEIECFGSLFTDPSVRRSSRAGRAHLLTQENSPMAHGIKRIAERLVRLWGRPIPQSRERLVRDTSALYRKWTGAV